MSKPMGLDERNRRLRRAGICPNDPNKPKLNILTEQLRLLQSIMDEKLEIGVIQRENISTDFKELPFELYTRLRLAYKKHGPFIDDELRKEVLSKMMEIINFKSLLRDFGRISRVFDKIRS